MADLASERDKRQQLEKRLREIEDASKSDEEKKVAADQKRDADLVTANRKVAQFEAAAEVGLPLSWATRIAGQSKDDIIADAKKVLADVAQLNKKAQHTEGVGHSGGGEPQVSPGVGRIDSYYASKAASK